MALSDQLHRCLADQTLSVPPECYVSHDVADLEFGAIFDSSWIGIGRADLVSSPGDYLAWDHLGHSIIILRDKQGTLKALANTCRHRAARLTNGSGNCRGLRCPFHSWAYRLDGTLVAAPEIQDEPGFDPGDYGLKSYAIEERAGFAFLCLGEPAQSLGDQLGNFSVVHRSWPIATLASTRRHEFEVACNWKAFLDVFNEYYHLPFVHPNSIDDVYDRPLPGDAVAGEFASQFGPTEGTGGLLQDEQDKALPNMPGLTGEAEYGVRYTWAFPNMTFAIGRDAMWVYEAYPLGTERCHIVQTACFPPETLSDTAAAEKVAAYHSRLDAAIDEDIPALENQQKGLASPLAVQGPFHPLLEANVAAFARWYAGKLTPALSQQGPKR